MPTINKIQLNDTTYDIGGGLTSDVKESLLALFEEVAYKDDDAQDVYDALEAAFFPPAGLASISAVYTQSGPVYTTDSLNSLKADLVVTATYEDSTTQTITTYTLSGTLTEGTSTITVSYGGKTTTFTVTVTVYTTAPRIAYENKSLKSDGTMRDTTGACVTEKYVYTMDVAGAKASQYYDSTNDYFTQNQTLFRFVQNFANPDSIAFSGQDYIVYWDKNDILVGYKSPTWGSDANKGDSLRNSSYANLEDGKLSIAFTLTMAGAANSYAYWTESLVGLLPVGVSDGDIIFAGSNTPYYNKRNINDS